MQIHFYAQVIILQALMYITLLFYSNAQQQGGGGGGVGLEPGARILCHASWGGPEASAFLVPVKKKNGYRQELIHHRNKVI